MDYKAILNLMKEMNQTELTKLEIEEEGIRIFMEKASNTITVEQAHPIAPVTYPANPYGMMPMQPPVVPVQAAAVQMEQSVSTQAPVVEKESEEEGSKKIVSPMVGTYYASPSPDKPAFVKVGDIVKKGQTVCIIEAMKLMNEIESDHDGEVVKILVNNEEMVEYGKPLFLIK